MTLPSGAHLAGAAADSRIVVTGAASCNLFTIADVSNVTLRDLWLHGNGEAAGFGTGYAVNLSLSAETTKAVNGFQHHRLPV